MWRKLPDNGLHGGILMAISGGWFFTATVVMRFEDRMMRCEQTLQRSSPHPGGRAATTC